MARKIEVWTTAIERTYKAPVARVWDMWTTAAGLEAWYWPEPLVAKVLRLDVRVGGGYEIAAPGLPHTSRGTYTQVTPRTLLAMRAHIDFVPGVAPYDRQDRVEFHALAGGGTRLVLVATCMHDDTLDELHRRGMTSSLDKLDRALA